MQETLQELTEKLYREGVDRANEEANRLLDEARRKAAELVATARREADGVTLAFVITDTAHDIPVRYKGILPDLFKEGKGAVAQGKVGDDGVFTASEVLAKHDENYMPPEAAKAVGDAQAQKAAIEATAKTVKQ